MPINVDQSPEVFVSHQPGCGVRCQLSMLRLTKNVAGVSNEPFGTGISAALPEPPNNSDTHNKAYSCTRRLNHNNKAGACVESRFKFGMAQRDSTPAT